MKPKPLTLYAFFIGEVYPQLLLLRVLLAGVQKQLQPTVFQEIATVLHYLIDFIDQILMVCLTQLYVCLLAESP
jgi:hypothetical protein